MSCGPWMPYVRGVATVPSLSREPVPPRVVGKRKNSKANDPIQEQTVRTGEEKTESRGRRRACARAGLDGDVVKEREHGEGVRGGR